MFDRSWKASLAIVVVGALGLLTLHAQQAQKQFKDRGEYDLYDSIIKEQDLNKRLALLNTWKQKYPQTDYNADRLQATIATYNALNQPDKVLETGSQLLQADPKNLQALYLMTLNVQRLPRPTPEQLAVGGQSGDGLLANLDIFFTAEKKPASMSEADWKKARTDTETLAQTTLGWIGLQKKDNESAEKHFAKSLESAPNNAQVSYWLGTAILGQKKPERQSEALFHFARAASLDSNQGGLNPEGRRTVDTYFVNAYNRFHGKDDAGLAELRNLAKASAVPPAGFKIKDINELAAEGEAEFAKRNPELALWRNIKNELTGARGDDYFNANMKDSAIPARFKAKVISMKPAVKPKELVVSIADGTTPDATLKFEEPLPGKVDPGAEIEFKGVAKEFAKEPFMVTFEVDKESLSGWTGKDVAPARRPAAKKGPAAGAKKKG